MTLGRRILTSTGWAASSAYVAAGISFIGNIFLARLLLPNDFGVYALAASILSLLFMISGFGSQESIIQCHDDTIRQLIPTAFWMTIALGLCLAVAGSVAGVLLLPNYGETLALLIVLLSWLSLIANIGYAYQAILQRHLIYKPIAVTQTLGTFVSFGLAILAAYSHYGIWSLFVREATQTLFVLAGFAWASGYRLQLTIDLRAARWIWHFGWKIMLSRIGEILFERVDKIVVGTLLGTTILGQYSMAYRLALVGNQFSYGPLQGITFSAFSKVQQDIEKLRQVFEKLYYWLFRISAILGLVVWFCGAGLVVFIYGPKWQPAGYVFHNMAILLAFLPLETSLRMFLVGAGHIDNSLRVRVCQLIFFVPAVLAAAYWGGIIWAVWSINASICLGWFLAIRYTSRVIPVRWDYLMQKPAIATIISYVSVAMANKGGYLMGGDFLTILLRAIMLGTVFIAALYLLERQSLWAEWTLIRTRLASS